jgi:hypothetical protein
MTTASAEINKSTAKRNPGEEEAATRYYLCIAFLHGNKSTTVAHVVIKNITKYLCQLTKQKN